MLYWGTVIREVDWEHTSIMPLLKSREQTALSFAYTPMHISFCYPLYLVYTHDACDVVRVDVEVLEIISGRHSPRSPASLYKQIWRQAQSATGRVAADLPDPPHHRILSDHVRDERGHCLHAGRGVCVCVCVCVCCLCGWWMGVATEVIVKHGRVNRWAWLLHPCITSPWALLSDFAETFSYSHSPLTCPSLWLWYDWHSHPSTTNYFRDGCLTRWTTQSFTSSGRSCFWTWTKSIGCASHLTRITLHTRSYMHTRMRMQCTNNTHVVCVILVQMIAIAFALKDRCYTAFRACWLLCLSQPWTCWSRLSRRKRNVNSRI